ncbi:MAG: PD40 domain-containing protein [Bacteroidales bacterium]|nr:PD40 domain-containing protein [Bacteroidales bacterium]
MMKRLVFTIYILLSALIALPLAANAAADLPDSLVRKGDHLHATYDFDAAVLAYNRAVEMIEDTAGDSLKILALKDKLLLSENARNMMGFVYSPVVVAKHKFGIEDFHLYYPLPDKSWRPVPNQLDSASAEGLTRAVYVPEGLQKIYFSSEDADGIRNIYMTEYQDTLWSCPALLNEHLVSPGDEIYPMLSPDGRTLYFASEGLYGIGGYDIYMSEWSDEDNDWSVPVNMGFPYSSPADDFLFITTEDEKYTVFASNRDCAADSVWVYVLEYDSMPVRKAVEDPESLRQLALLEPEVPGLDEKEVKTDIPESVDTRKYMEKMVEVRALRDSLANTNSLLENDRNRFALSNDYAERMKLTDIILRRESRIPQLQDSLDRATAELQKIEMEFLFSGVVIDPDKMMAEADREVVEDMTGYAFTKMTPGYPLQIVLAEPENKFDYSFKILEEGQFAEDNTIPDGIVYQIQIFSALNKASVKSLKGLSPVFERKNSGGRYIYRVGLFNTYNDVLSKLNAVKKVGFRSAFIVAYIDGNEVSVSKARSAETKVKEEQKFYQVMLVPSGEMDSALSEGIRQQAGGKDIARSEANDGRPAYIVGPFADKEQAESLVTFIKAMGENEVYINEIQN